MVETKPRRFPYLSLTFAVFVGYLVALLMFTRACNDYRQLHEQLPTFANLQDVAIAIQREIDEKSKISDAEARLLIGQYFENRRDVWGDEILYLPSTTPSIRSCSSPPAATGSSTSKIPGSTSMPSRERIIGQLDRDIVFRDGIAVTSAGKD